MKRFLIVFLSVVFLWGHVQAASWYVKPDSYAEGSNTGVDWGNAFYGMPVYSSTFWTESLQPGDTVYVAGGTYTTIWRINKSGTSEADRITIKRATNTEHGTNTGWNNDTDNATVVLSGVNIQFYAPTATYTGPSYVTIDGVVENGIKVDMSGVAGDIVLLSYNNKGRTNYITLKNIEGKGYGVGCEVANCNGIKDTAISTTMDNNHTGLKIQNCTIYNVCGAALYLYNSHNAIIENCVVHDIGGLGGEIHEDFLIVYDSDNGTVRNNIMYDTASLGILFEIGINEGWQVYNNLFYQTKWEEETISAIKFSNKTGASYRRCKIFNNTLYNYNAGLYIPASTTGDYQVEAYNNIFYNAPATYLGDNATHDYNYYDVAQPSVGAEAHGIYSGADPFVDSSTYNFILDEDSSAADNGTNLSTYFTTDLNGTARTVPWSKGAYEVDAGVTTTTVATTTSVAITSSTSTSITTAPTTEPTTTTTIYSGAPSPPTPKGMIWIKRWRKTWETGRKEWRGF